MFVVPVHSVLLQIPVKIAREEELLCCCGFVPVTHACAINKLVSTEMV